MYIQKTSQATLIVSSMFYYVEGKINDLYSTDVRKLFLFEWLGWL